MKGISILGSTGSIGVQTLDVIRRHPGLFKAVGLAAGSNIDLLERQIREFRPSVISCSDENAARELKNRLNDHNYRLWIGHSQEGLEAVATAGEAELVVGGLPGSAGLRPSFAAVESGKDIALATKEVLVMAGRLFMEKVQATGVRLLPVDSEQSAIFQCIQGSRGAGIERIILTASGGPFREKSADEIAKVTREEALNHPRWKMGPKVTIDSATLMNKGLEVIEARWLFDVPAARIEVVIHPESIVHSMVEFRDGSILAQLGATDMRIPISYALAFPDRVESGAQHVSFPSLGSLHFHQPDTVKFPLLSAAYQALENDTDVAAIVLNAADEVAVGLFLGGTISFDQIPTMVLRALDTITVSRVRSLEDVEDLHREVVNRVLTDWAIFSGR